MTGVQAFLGSFKKTVDRALGEMDYENVISRIWARDHTLWKPEPTEISNRLGWLDCPANMATALPGLELFAAEIQSDGFTRVLLIGMGGSSLAPEVFQKTFSVRRGYLDLSVIDSIAPADILATARQLDFQKTLFIVSSKSGTTIETIALFKFFYSQLSASLGNKLAGERFVAITDQNSPLAKLAIKNSFRRVFYPDANIGGRYAALSLIGLVPAALIGIELHKLLERAVDMSERCALPGRENPAALLGVIMGELAKAGRDKLTLTGPAALEPFGSWLEQLVAESTGKEGQGILPIIGERVLKPEQYSNDRLLVNISLPDEAKPRVVNKELQQSDHPAIQIPLRDRYDLGGQFFLWEMATAIACWRLGVNPFDQPNVEDSKARARQMTAQYTARAKISETTPVIQVEFEPDKLKQAIKTFLSDPGHYVSLQAYLPATPENNDALQALRASIGATSQLAATMGYGPRFLHSTGQLHKGDAGHGLFIQLICDPAEDVAIPDEPDSTESSLTFGQLQRATALGDREALLDAHRKVLTLQLGPDTVADINRLADAIRQSP